MIRAIGWAIGRVVVAASKPIAILLVKQADVHPGLRSRMVNLGQTNHRLHRKLDRSLANQPTDVEISPLREDLAVLNGATAIGELVLYTVVGGLATFEVRRRKARKDEEVPSEIFEPRARQLIGRSEALEREIELLRKENKEILWLSRKQVASGSVKFNDPDARSKNG